MIFHCFCGEREDMKHVYYCKKINKHKRETEKYSMIYNENISQQISVYKIFEVNYKQREKLIQIQKKRKKTNPPCYPIVSAIL